MTAIMNTSIKQVVASADGRDFRDLKTLRLVSKQWRDAVDAAAGKHYEHIVSLVATATKSRSVEDVLKARDAALGSGLPTLAVLQDSLGPVSMLNYMRVKSVKTPGALPPATHPLSETQAEQLQYCIEDNCQGFVTLEEARILWDRNIGDIRKTVADIARLYFKRKGARSELAMQSGGVA